MRRREGQKIQRAATRVEIQHHIGQRHQLGRDEITDLGSDTAIGLSRKAAVHVGPIDGRTAFARRKGWHVHHRQDNRPPGDLIGGQCHGQILKRNWPFVFIAVIGPRQQCGWPCAIGNHRDRDHHRPPSAVIAAVGQFQKPVMHALRIQWNRGGDRVGRHRFTHNSRGVLHRHSWPASVIKIGSVISSPPSSSQSAGMK